MEKNCQKMSLKLDSIKRAQTLNQQVKVKFARNK